MGWTTEWLSRTLQRHPAALRALIRLTAFVRPPGFAIGTAREVHDIFDRTHDFQVGITIAPKTKTGPFLLSMDEGPRHTRERRALVSAIGGPFHRRFGQIAAGESHALAEHVAETLVEGQPYDLASEYAERVFVRTLATYFGLPIDGWRSEHLEAEPGERTLALFIRYLGATIGSGDSPAPFGLGQLADAIGKEFKEQLDAVIKAERTKQPNDTVLGHLLHPSPEETLDAQYLEQDGLSRSIAGLLAAGASFPKAVANVLYELSERKLLAGLIAKARDRSISDAAWQSIIEPYVLEALRFRPLFPLLIRQCPRSAQLGGREIAAGSTVTFSPLAAMFDPEQFERPDEFIAGRPAEKYLIFGAPPRACVGKDMMLGLFPTLLRALFTRVSIDETPGAFRYDAVALEHYWVTLKRAEDYQKPSTSSGGPRPPEDPLLPLAAGSERTPTLPPSAAEPFTETSLDVILLDATNAHLRPSVIASKPGDRDSRPA